MTTTLLLKSSAEDVSLIVDKTKVLVDRLRCALIHQDNLTKAYFDTTATELSKTVESIKKSCLKLEDEYQAVNEEIIAGEERLNGVLEEHKKLVEENVQLKNVENGFSNSKTVADENKKIARELRVKLQVYKRLTGVRFDISDSADTSIGYVAVCGNKPSNSVLIPFEIEVNKGNCKNLFWNKISEACSEVSE